MSGMVKQDEKNELLCVPVQVTVAMAGLPWCLEMSKGGDLKA